MGRPAGSFNIPIDQKPRLTELLHHTTNVLKLPASLVERPMSHTIIKADLDFRYPIEQGDRKYTIDHIRTIAELYNAAIKYYLDVPEDTLKMFVFERDLPYKDKGNTKDGIHLMYPLIICHSDIQHLIREHVILHGQAFFDSLGCKNSINDIVDKSVISTNGWLMYTCSKPMIKPYRLTHIYDHEYNDLNIKKYPSKDLISLLSIRDHDINLSKNIRPEHKYLLEKKNTVVTSAKPKKLIKVTKLNNANQMQGDYNLDEVRALVNLLNSERADNYKQWIEVGLCLHNINISLMDSWIDFSRKSSKFKEGECEDTWGSMCTRDDGGLGMGSLHRWAKLDNPKGYEEVSRDGLDKDILKSQSQTTQDVARVVYTMYKYTYKCTSIKHGVWYEFKDHRWHQIDSGITLRKRIGNDVVNAYLRLITSYNNTAYEQQDENKDQFLQKSKNLTDVTYRLRDYTFKEKIMKECQTMFYDQHFESLLDANPDLIGFENGVYDLRNGEFRDGRPEDNVSLSTGNDYIEFKEDDEMIVAIFNFLAQVFPDPETRDYVLILLASFLEGRNPNEKFHIWTGVGGNGKSKLLELFEGAFGKYTAKIPVTIFTQKNKASSNAANPEVARLKGIRTVSTQEPEESNHFNVGVMKDWSGNDRITCRPLYKEPFDFKPQFKMVFCCNTLPTLPPDDGGTWRRISVVEFKSRFVDNPDPKNIYEFRKDPHLAEKLHSWREAFMYILLEHFKQYKKQGLVEPVSVKDATREYQKMNDSYVEFLNDCTVKDENSSVKLEDMYKRFRDWWKENASGKAPTRKDMKASLEKKMGKYLSSSKGGWRGYKMIYQGDEATDDKPEIIIGSGRITNELKGDQ